MVATMVPQHLGGGHRQEQDSEVGPFDRRHSNQQININGTDPCERGQIGD
jgi:hypothetical protein